MAAFDINKWRKKAISLYGKSRGLTASQRADVTSQVRGAKTFKPKKTKKKSRTMAKKKTKKRRSFTLPIAIVAPLGASVVTPGKAGWGGSPGEHIMQGNWKHALNHLVAGWTGYSIPDGGKFDFVNGALYLKMTLAGMAIHWVAGKVGLNRALGRARIPFLRI